MNSNTYLDQEDAWEYAQACEDRALAEEARKILERWAARRLLEAAARKPRNGEK